MFSDWVSFLAYPNLFGIKGFVVVVVVVVFDMGNGKTFFSLSKWVRVWVKIIS
jgi:hypothetical protein